MYAKKFTLTIFLWQTVFQHQQTFYYVKDIRFLRLIHILIKLNNPSCCSNILLRYEYIFTKIFFLQWFITEILCTIYTQFLFNNLLAGEVDWPPWYGIFHQPKWDTRISVRPSSFVLCHAQETPPGFWNGVDWRALVESRPFGIFGLFLGLF